MSIELPKKSWGLVIFLNLLALTIAISIFFKAIVDVDRSFDTWWYHIPFAARLWNIVPAEQYTNFVKEEYRYLGFPLLVEYLGGFFWFVTRHVQASNLVNYFSLLLYCFFLNSYFQVPFYLSGIALLAIPLVQIHASSFYVDLPGAVLLSALILTTYYLYVHRGKEVDNRRNFILILLVSVAAVNTKFQLIPIVAFVLSFALLRIVWLRWQLIRAGKKTYRWLLKLLPIVILAGLLIFATPLKNVVIYGNPFYPIRFELAGIVLNHDVGFYQHASDLIKDRPQVVRWLYSIFEVNSPLWSIDQWSPDAAKSRLGGFFGAYVAFNLLVLGYIFWQNRCRETKVVIAILGIMSAVTAIAPQSHELRYYMYWMITLVSFNLLLVSHLEKSRSPQTPSLLNFRHLAIACLPFLVVVAVKTNFSYIAPKFYTLDKHIQTFVDPATFKKIQPGDNVCLVNKSFQYRKTFLYTPYFHPQLGYSFSIRSALDPSECKEIKKIIDVY
ncbi:MAG: hypothetical protein QNJ41_18665 [Xenococcaceae cyanobacterium MO_188.B32]|nr:hypothetical protein [Xenococcaceae cyanobacterium MO_188.B32]